MRSIKLLKTAFMLGMASLSLATYAAGGPDTFMNGQSYYGEPTTQVAAARVVDIASSGRITVAYGETVTFRSESTQFSWIFNGLDRRSVDVAKIAPAGFAVKPFVAYVGRNPANRR